MRTSRFTDEQIIGIVREHGWTAQLFNGAKLAELCRKHGASPATFYKWRAKYGGMAVSDAKRLRALEEENRRLKQLLADTMLDNQALKGLLAKNW
jgi:putative transposase